MPAASKKKKSARKKGLEMSNTTPTGGPPRPTANAPITDPKPAEIFNTLSFVKRFGIKTAADKNQRP